MSHKKHKKTIALIQLGNFLEYFDLMLYVHMADFLNTLFFPPAQGLSQQWLLALSFCATFLFRPLGGILFGMLGDHIGRKFSLTLTTLCMALASTILAALPPYQAIGLSASLIMIFCRMLQGMSSAGEAIGANLFMIEVTSPRWRGFFTSLVEVTGSLGSAFALAAGALFLQMNIENGWRMAFVLGSAIAVIGTTARTRIKETPAFLRARHHELPFRGLLKLFKDNPSLLRHAALYAAVQSLYPVGIYLTYIHFKGVLRNISGLSESAILWHNFDIALFNTGLLLVAGSLSLWLSSRFLLRVRGVFMVLVALTLPWICTSSLTSLSIFGIQIALLMGNTAPADPLFIENFPVLGRYTLSAFLSGTARTLTYGITALGCVILDAHAGIWGIAGLLLVFSLLFLWAAWSIEDGPHAENPSLLKQNQA